MQTSKNIIQLINYEPEDDYDLETLTITWQNKLKLDVSWIEQVESDLDLQMPLALKILMNKLIFDLIGKKDVSFNRVYGIIYCYSMWGCFSIDNIYKPAKPEYPKERRIELLNYICTVFCDNYPMYAEIFKSVFMFPLKYKHE